MLGARSSKGRAPAAASCAPIIYIYIYIYTYIYNYLYIYIHTYYIYIYIYIHTHISLRHLGGDLAHDVGGLGRRRLAAQSREPRIGRGAVFSIVKCRVYNMLCYKHKHAFIKINTHSLRQSPSPDFQTTPRGPGNATPSS